MSSSGGPLTGAQVHASAHAHHAVPAESHRAGDHLRRLRQLRAGHIHPPHDHPEQTGGSAGHLCRQVGQSSARLVPPRALLRLVF